MLKTIQQRDKPKNRWVKIAISVFLGLVCASMLTYLIPGLTSGTTGASSPDAIATIGGQSITVTDFQQQYEQATRNSTIPPMLKAAYMKQIRDQMIFQRALEYEAGRLGMSVTPQEVAERIKEILPDAWSGDTWLKDRYTNEVQTRTGMSVSEFETLLQNEMLIEKFRELVTDGVTVNPEDVAREFRWRNEKVKVDYAVIKPSDLAASIHPSDADLGAWFAKNSLRYQIPEQRSARYALLDRSKLRAAISVNEETLRDYYNSHLDDYKVENRVNLDRILFKTTGKTDAEIAEIRKKAEDVLKQAKHGANFEDLAKKYSEDDNTKAKGGALGWIVEGQTVPAFQQAAFSLPKGAISDLVQTQYGFDIIKVLDRETARTKSYEEVRDSILQPVLDQRVNVEAGDIAGQMAAAVRQSDRQSLDDLAKKFNLEVGVTSLAGVTDPILPLGDSPELHESLFALRTGELSRPIEIDSGYVILAVKDIKSAHQATLAEVHDRALQDYQNEKSGDLARARAEELSKRAQAGEDFDKTAKSLGLATRTSDSVSRSGSVPEIGSAKQIAVAFNMTVGEVSAPAQSGSNWFVFRTISREPFNPSDLAAQQNDLFQQLLQTKQSAAFEAFRTDLIARLKKEGKLKINSEAFDRITKSS